MLCLYVGDVDVDDEAEVELIESGEALALALTAPGHRARIRMTVVTHKDCANLIDF